MSGTRTNLQVRSCSQCVFWVYVYWPVDVCANLDEESPERRLGHLGHLGHLG